LSNLLIFDGTYFLYRSYHAMPPLSTSDGRPTGAIKGAVNALQSVMRNIKPKYAVAVFDGAGKTFRHDLYPEYKGNRPPRPSDLSPQFDPLMAITRAMGITTICAEGMRVEADDVIGTIARQVQELDGFHVKIATGDKDMAQLVNKKVSLVNPYSDKWPVMRPDEVYQRFGVRPDQIIEYLAIIGDIADNIIGLRGVGPKTAANWLLKYGTLDNILKNVNQLPERFRPLLLDSVEQLKLNVQLTTIKLDVPLNYSILDYEAKGFDVEELMWIFEDLEFNDSLFRS